LLSCQELHPLNPTGDGSRGIAPAVVTFNEDALRGNFIVEFEVARHDCGCCLNLQNSIRKTEKPLKDILDSTSRKILNNQEKINITFNFSLHAVFIK